MTGLAGRPLLCPTLIGRTAQIAALEAALDASLAGQSRTLLVAGEAGIGKSRLVDEAARRAVEHGFLVLRGGCFQTDTACPYAPLLDLWRTYLGGLPMEERLARCGPGVAALRALLPDLLPPPDPAPALDAEQEKRRLFADMARCFFHQAARQPLLVVIEDIHWSDEASLECLHFLIRRGAGEGLLLLATYRDDEAPPGLRAWLADLARARLVEELPLARLTRAQVEVMMRAIFDLVGPPRPDFIAAIHDLTQGNPFFIEEVLTSLVAAGEVFTVAGGWASRPLGRLAIPRSVAAAVQFRRARLDDDARHLLDVAAVAGRRFDFAVLQRVTGHDEARLVAAIKALIAARLVVEEALDQFAFRHALTRQAVYADLLGRERLTLHRAVADALEEQPGAAETRLEDLAYHCHEAGHWEKALHYSARAGERAWTLAAPHAVVEHIGRALAAAGRLGRPTPAYLHHLRARAHDMLGDFEAARADYEAALHLVEASGDRRDAWQTFLDLGLLWTSRDLDRGRDYLSRALDLARALDDPALLAHSLNRLGNWHANIDEPERAETLHQEALAIFERLDDQPGLAATLDLLSMARGLAGDLAGAVRAAESASALFRRLGDRQGLIGGLLVRSMATGAMYEVNTMALPAGHVTDQQSADEPLALAREIGWRSGEAYVLCFLGEALGSIGETGRGLNFLRSGLAIAEEIGHREWMVQAHWGLGGVLGDLLALPAAREHHERALALAIAMDSPLWRRIAAGGLASTLIARGEHDRAVALLDAEAPAALPMRTQGQRLLWRARAELALAQDAPDDALAIVNRLYAVAANLTDEGAIPSLALLKARALSQVGRPAEALALLEAACRVATRHGYRPALWRLRAALAHLHRVAGRSEAARAEADTARAIIEELASLATDDLVDAFRQAALAELPGLAPLPARQAAKAAFGGLTAREREVAGWVARGLSNREIAGTLSIGERTVETHVASILLKLQFSSRAQIAAWSVERGLTGASA